MLFPGQSKSPTSEHFKPRSATTLGKLSNHQSLHSRSTSPPHPAHDNASLTDYTSKGFSLLPNTGDGCTRKRVYEAGEGEEVEKHRTVWEIGLLDVDGGLASIEVAPPMRCSDDNAHFVSFDSAMSTDICQLGRGTGTRFIATYIPAPRIQAEDSSESM